MKAPVVGILGLQGGVSAHAGLLRRLGARPAFVRNADDLAAVDALIIPGGESSVIGRLINLAGLRAPILDSVRQGLPVLGTCAGMVVLADSIDNPAPGQVPLGLVPFEVRRNAFGPQVDSAEFTADWQWPGEPAQRIRAAAIRAPEVSALGPGVDVICRARIGNRDRILGVRYGRLIALALHPELTDDVTAHRALLRQIPGREHHS